MSCLCKGHLCKVDDLLLSRVMHRHTFSSCWKNMNSSMSPSLSSSSLLQVHASWPLFCLCLHKVGIIAAPPLSITISQPLGLTPCLVSDSCRNSISVLGLVILVYIRHNNAVILIDTGSFVKLRNFRLLVITRSWGSHHFGNMENAHWFIFVFNLPLCNLWIS